MFFLWILYSNMVVLVKYNQLKKKKKKGRVDTQTQGVKRLKLELNSYVVPDRRYKVNGKEKK